MVDLWSGEQFWLDLVLTRESPFSDHISKGAWKTLLQREEVEFSGRHCEKIRILKVED